MKIAAFFLSIALVFSGCSQKPGQQEYITIGVLLPLTGPDSDDGLRAFNGLQLAKQEINANGGVLGRQLDLVILNDRGDRNYIIEQYEALKKKGVAAIIGSVYSNVTLHLAQAAEKDGIPLISPTASNPEITKNRSNVFRAIFIDDYQAEVLAYFARNTLKAQSAVVIVDTEDPGFALIADSFMEFFTKQGGQIIAVELYTEDAQLPGIIRKYSARQPDIIFSANYYSAAASLVNLVYEAGFKNTRLLGSDAWDGLLTYVYHPEAMKNVFFPSPFSFDDRDENVVRFVKNYFSSFSQMPLSASATAYTCVYILAEAITIAGNTNSGEIVSAMKSIDMEMITGRITFDEDNNPRPNIYIMQIEGGEYSTYLKIGL